MPLRPRHWYIVGVASLEQIIGAALSTIVGIMISLILLQGMPQLNAFEQGLLGASGLVGIACGSFLIGKLMDSTGYLLWFRLCPIIIAAGSAGVFFSGGVWALAFFLFVTGTGVGGGYPLDSGYISEIVPTEWEGFFVGLAKAVCSLGFIGGAAISYFMLAAKPSPQIWHSLILITAILGILAFLLRIRWYQSPRWLLNKGEKAKAEQAARDFLGPEAEIILLGKGQAATKPVSLALMFEGERLKKVILSGVTWACEGLGVYGFGVFLPILVMALGLQGETAAGIPRVMESVKTTIFINLFIAAGFAIGLAILHKVNSIRLMGWCFIFCSISLAFLLVSYQCGWPTWIGFLCFVVFETALNAGPHLVTYVIPSKIFGISDRGEGTGIATMFGKIGAVAGVFLMPALLHWGGVSAVLWTSAAVMLIGAAVSFIFGKSLKLL